MTRLDGDPTPEARVGYGAVRMVTAPVVPWLVAATLVALATHGYLWLRWVRAPGLPRPALLGVVFALLAALMPAGLLGLLYMRVLPRAVAQPLMTLAFTHLGATFFALVLTVALEPWAWVDRSRIGARRRLLLALGGTLTLVSFSIFSALRPPAIVHQRVILPSLPAPLRGYRAVQLSDLHIGPTLGKAFLADVVARCNAQSPDVVIITGDSVDGTPDELLEQLAPLRDLRARDGVYLVFGNHEYLSGADAWRAALTAFPLRVLRNEQVQLRPGLALIGVDDALPEGGADFAAAFANHDRRSTAIVAVHEPAAIAETQRRGASLQLSGHTHGGQIFPLHLLARLEQGYLEGLYTVGGAVLHVSPGTGFWGPPMRLGSRAELSVLELEP